MELIPSKEAPIEGLPAPKPTKKLTMVLYLDRCVHCGRCAEVCPKAAIALDEEFELANFTRSALRLVQE
jgi:formate hydrogenlyase subunit 6/NADH:ubiquinone oxidoreductase subunit I